MAAWGGRGLLGSMWQAAQLWQCCCCSCGGVSVCTGLAQCVTLQSYALQHVLLPAAHSRLLDKKAVQGRSP